MSYAIMRAIKVKAASDVVGCEIHNERLKDHSNSNPDIDFEKAKDDYSIGTYGAERYNQRIDREIKERYTGKRAIRKDATRCIELMFTSDGDFFKGLTPEQEKAYFKDCYEFAVEHFGGRANIIGDKVHKDEKTPHMHLDIVPLTADGRLSAKEFLGGKKELQALQDKFYEEVGKKWGLDRGSRADLEQGESGKRHKSTQELKQETIAKLDAEISQKRATVEKAEKIIAEQQKKISSLNNKLGKMSVKKLDEIDKNSKEMLGNVVLKKEYYKELKSNYEAGLYACEEAETYKREMGEYKSLWQYNSEELEKREKELRNVKLQLERKEKDIQLLEAFKAKVIYFLHCSFPEVEEALNRFLNPPKKEKEKSLTKSKNKGYERD